MRLTRLSWLCMIAACHPATATTPRHHVTFSLLGGAHAAAQDDVAMADAGSGVSVTFEGTGVALELHNAARGDHVYYQVTLDGNTENLVHGQPTATRYTYDELPMGVHHIAVRRLNGSDHGTGHLSRIALLHGSQFVVGPQAAHRVEFVGGDLTAGGGLEDMDDTFAWTANAALSLAGQTAKGLHADYRVRAAEGWAPARGWQPHAVVIEMHDEVDLTVQKVQRAYPLAQVLLFIGPHQEGETLLAARSAAAATGLPVVTFHDAEAGRGDSYAHYVMARALRNALLETAHWQKPVSVAGGSTQTPSLF